MNTHGYFDVYYLPGTNPVFCYRTGLAVYEEALIGGAFVAQGWNAAGYPLDVLANCPTRLDPKVFGEPFAFNIEVNGCSVDHHLTFVDFSVDREPDRLHAVLTLDSQIAPVRIKVHTILDGTAMFTRWLELENLTEAPLVISRMNPLAGGVEVLQKNSVNPMTDPDQIYSVGYFDDDSWATEGDFSWHTLRPDVTSIDMRFNRDRHRHPALFLRNNLLGTTWFAQIAYSGGCRFTVDYNAKLSQSQTTLAFKAEITGHKPLLMLEAKEVFCTPEVHMGVVHGDLDMAVNEMIAHARKSVLNLPEADSSACLVVSGIGPEHDMITEPIKAYIDQFAEMGGEIFIIDAGWQNPPNREMEWFKFNGMNYPDQDRYPNGMGEISDYCHEKGLKFCLWVEIERAGAYSPVYKEHPEWFLDNVYQEKSTGGFIDFTNPEAARWAEDELARIIEEYKLDMLRVDYNVDHREYHAMKPYSGGLQEDTALRHFKAVCAMYLNLKKRFPHVIFENCAGGGGRTDWEQIKAFNHTWVSDCAKIPRSVLITNGMTMVLPPERVDRLVGGMGCHEFGSFDAHMRNTLFGHMTLNAIACARTRTNPVQMEFVKRNVKLYKEFIRPILPTATIYHPTPDVKESVRQGYTMLELTAADRSRGIFGVFTLSGSGEREISFTLKGVDVSRTYRVTLDNLGASFEKSGAELYLNGLTVKVPSSMSSELVVYEAL